MPFAAVHTYDKAYDGTGNWPFNTAYAASYGLNSSVRVLGSLRDVEAQIKLGNPVIIPLSWDNTNANTDDDLTGAGVLSSGGHLLVVRGFTSDGRVIANDPATAKGEGNAQVRREDDRTQFKRQWLNSNSGVAYTFSR